MREPYSWPDVLGSIANYLRMNGYKKNSSDYRKGGDIYKSVYAYNHADNYVMAVLELTERIRSVQVLENIIQLLLLILIENALECISLKVGLQIRQLIWTWVE